MSQFPAYLKPAAIRQIDIHKQQMKLLFYQNIKRLSTAYYNLYLIAVAFQHIFCNAGKILVVFYD